MGVRRLRGRIKDSRRLLMTCFCCGVLLLTGVIAVPCTALEQPAQLSESIVLSPPGKFKPQYFPQAAWSAETQQWLVVWQEGVPTDDGTDGEGAAQSILGVRVSAAGKAIDAKPIEICSAKGSQQRPVVASDGHDFLVVWHDLRAGKDWDLYGARVTQSGKVLDRDGALLVGGAHNQCFPAIVFGGENYYVVWLDMRHFPEYRVFGSLVSPKTGMPLNGQGVELIRVMTDERREKWRTAPFSAGYNGLGTYKHIRQPGPPTLTTNGTNHLVASIEHVGDPYAPSGGFLRSVSSASGEPQGELKSIPVMVRTPIRTRTGYSRFGAVATSNRFLLGLHLFESGFGLGPGVFWTTAQCSPDGSPSQEMWDTSAFADVPPETKGTWRPTYVEVRGAATYPPGYRNYGKRPVVLRLAWDGKRGFMVCERFNHTKTTLGDMNIQGFFIDAEGKRLSNPATGEAVGPDVYNKPKQSQVEQVKVSPIAIADGPATQSCPCVVAGPSGAFLVVWQEENANSDSRVMARVVSIR